ncbi:hypothetical protein Agub_g1156 [Astrephomene gubernaculifera]|uniref:Sugar phosphate transporter domain-containing protein n=1 Tax=Astrephomene gubernaculifera TaxID=47775 RepID=A0AAD3DIG7_9CHLO|nr:hypothetical protein Agub_g1156 [Astrephomene gubernaculifera]
MVAAGADSDKDERTPFVGHAKPNDSSGSWLRALVALVASIAWMVVSSALIMLNKYIMVDLGFRYPMAITSMGMGMSAFLAFVCCRVLKLVAVHDNIELRFWLAKLLPIGLLMALTLWTGNEVYLHLTVAFIQMLKAFTPVITMICLITAKLEYPTRAMVASVLLTALGTATAAYGEVRMNIVGILLMFASEAAESVRLVMTQFLLVGLNFHPIEGLMYLAAACCLWLMSGCMVLEVPKMMAEGALKVVFANPWSFFCASMMGFTVNLLAYFTIKVASSLTLKVLGTVKNTLLVVCGMLFFGEVVTGLQGVGYAVSLMGFAWYNWLKIRQLAGGTAREPHVARVPGVRGAGAACNSGVTRSTMVAGSTGSASSSGSSGVGNIAELDSVSSTPTYALGVERRLHANQRQHHQALQEENWGGTSGGPTGTFSEAGVVIGIRAPLRGGTRPSHLAEPTIIVQK